MEEEPNWGEIGRACADSVKNLFVTQQELEPLIQGTIERIRKANSKIPFSSDQQSIFEFAFRTRYKERCHGQCRRKRRR